MNGTMNPRRPLERIQRWMQTTITHPDGVGAGMNSPSAREEVGVGADEAEKVVTRSKALTGVERLSIYSSAYYGRLLECLREEFPVLEAPPSATKSSTLSPSAICSNTRRGATRCFSSGPTSPASWTRRGLGRKGKKAPRRIGRTSSSTSPLWSGPSTRFSTGREWRGAPAGCRPTAVDFSRAPAGGASGAPCLRLLSLRYPVHRYFIAVRRREEPELLAPAETFLAVTRRSYVVRHYELSRTAYELLHALLAGESVGQALRQAVGGTGPDIDRLPDILAAWFHDWAAEGFFRGVKLAG